MSCKYPSNSRMYKACSLCSDYNICEDSIFINNPNIVNNTITLLSASEAHKQTINHIKICSTKELEVIRKKIADAIEDGKFFINGYGCLQNETIQRLKELNYKVETGNMNADKLYKGIAYWSISWQDN